LIVVEVVESAVRRRGASDVHHFGSTVHRSIVSPESFKETDGQKKWSEAVDLVYWIKPVQGELINNVGRNGGGVNQIDNRRKLSPVYPIHRLTGKFSDFSKIS
jgi:hypothetical protein